MQYLYAFCVEQFFVFVKKYVVFIGYDRSIIRIIISIGVCVIYVIVLYELIEKPILTPLRRKLLNKL